MSKNPVLKQKYIQGYQEGFNKGIDVGRKEGVSMSNSFFMEKFSTLATTHGIGPKTIQKVKEALGEQYFE